MSAEFSELENSSKVQQALYEAQIKIQQLRIDVEDQKNRFCKHQCKKIILKAYNIWTEAQLVLGRRTFGGFMDVAKKIITELSSIGTILTDRQVVQNAPLLQVESSPSKIEPVITIIRKNKHSNTLHRMGGVYLPVEEYARGIRTPNSLFHRWIRDSIHSYDDNSEVTGNSEKVYQNTNLKENSSSPELLIDISDYFSKIREEALEFIEIYKLADIDIAERIQKSANNFPYVYNRYNIEKSSKNQNIISKANDFCSSTRQLIAQQRQKIKNILEATKRPQTAEAEVQVNLKTYNYHKAAKKQLKSARNHNKDAAISEIDSSELSKAVKKVNMLEEQLMIEQYKRVQLQEGYKNRFEELESVRRELLLRNKKSQPSINTEVDVCGQQSMDCDNICESNSNSIRQSSSSSDNASYLESDTQLEPYKKKTSKNTRILKMFAPTADVNRSTEQFYHRVRRVAVGTQFPELAVLNTALNTQSQKSKTKVLIGDSLGDENQSNTGSQRKLEKFQNNMYQLSGQKRKMKKQRLTYDSKLKITKKGNSNDSDANNETNNDRLGTDSSNRQINNIESNLDYTPVDDPNSLNWSLHSDFGTKSSKGNKLALKPLSKLDEAKTCKVSKFVRFLNNSLKDEYFEPMEQDAPNSRRKSTQKLNSQTHGLKKQPINLNQTESADAFESQLQQVDSNRPNSKESKNIDNSSKSLDNKLRKGMETQRGRGQNNLESFLTQEKLEQEAKQLALKCINQMIFFKKLQALHRPRCGEECPHLKLYLKSFERYRSSRVLAPMGLCNVVNQAAGVDL